MDDINIVLIARSSARSSVHNSCLAALDTHLPQVVNYLQ